MKSTHLIIPATVDAAKNLAELAVSRLGAAIAGGAGDAEILSLRYEAAVMRKEHVQLRILEAETALATDAELFNLRQSSEWSGMAIEMFEVALDSLSRDRATRNRRDAKEFDAGSYEEEGVSLFGNCLDSLSLADRMKAYRNRPKRFG